jgi:hypothetical protein
MIDHSTGKVQEQENKFPEPKSIKKLSKSTPKKKRDCE